MNNSRDHYRDGVGEPQDVCPVSGLPIITRPEWTDLGSSDSYRVTFRLIGDRILHIIPRGTPDAATLALMFDHARKLADDMIGEGTPFVVIDDYARVNDTSSRSVRKQMVDGLLRNRHRLLGYIGFSASFRMSLAMKVSRRLFRFTFPVLAVKDYPAAVVRALVLLEENRIDGGSPSFASISRKEWQFHAERGMVAHRLINGNIIYSNNTGDLSRDDVAASLEILEKIVVHTVAQAGDYYLVVAPQQHRLSRETRDYYIDFISRLYERYPFQCFVFCRSNRFFRAVFYLARPRLDFPALITRDLDSALQLINSRQSLPRQSGSGTPVPADKAGEVPPDSVVDELLHYLGSINWETERQGRSLEKSEDDPLKPVYDAIDLIKTDLDDLLLKRREAERELRETLERESEIKEQLEMFRRFIVSSGEGMGWSDLDGRLVYVNETMCRILGENSLDEARGRYVAHYYDRETRRRIYGHIQPIVHRDGEWKGELTVCSRTGQRLPTLNDIFVIRDENGQIRYHAVIARDISDLKNAEQALRESEEKYRLLVNNAGDAICIAQDGVLKFVNPRLVTLLEYPPVELSRRPFVDLIHPEDASLTQEYYQQRLSGEKVPGPHSFRVFTKSGRLLWVQNNTVRISWDGRPAVLNFIRDITRQKEMEDHLRQALKMEAIGTLAGGIAHDFNNILAAVMGYTEVVLGETSQGTRSYRNLRQIRKAVLRARELVRQILTFSRPGEEALKSFQLTPIVKEVLKMIRATAPAGVDIVQEIAPGGFTVMADPSQIHEVVMNLCTNAIQAMGQGGIVTVEMTRVTLDDAQIPDHKNISPGHFVRLTVRDTGPGMPAEVGRRVFEPYFTTRPHGEGTGLGLSVVHGIVESMGGFITVDSGGGVGTVFNVYMPAFEAAESSWEAVTSDKPLSGGKERILLVDNDPQLLDSGRQMLEQLGYVVETSPDPMSARDILKTREGEFDLVITDMEMPEMTGLELAEAVYKINAQLPVIIYSGNDMQHICDREGTGIRKCLTKPFVAADLAWAIRDVLDGGDRCS